MNHHDPLTLPCDILNQTWLAHLYSDTKGQLEETEKISWFKLQLCHKMRPHHLHHWSMDARAAENLKANSRHDTTVEPTTPWNSLNWLKCLKWPIGFWMFWSSIQWFIPSEVSPRNWIHPTKSESESQVTWWACSESPQTRPWKSHARLNQRPGDPVQMRTQINSIDSRDHSIGL